MAEHKADPHEAAPHIPPRNPGAADFEDTSGAKLENATRFTLPRITVRSATPGRVGAHEYHHEHPNGEAWVGDDPVEVALTPFIKQRIRDNLLIAHDPPADMVDSLDDAARTAHALAEMNRERAAAQTKRDRLLEAAHDQAIAAEFSRAMAHGALSPEDHAKRADDIDKLAAKNREEAAKLRR